MKRAFTLVELLIYIGVISVLLAILGSVVVSTLDLQLESQDTSAVESDARYILNRITYDLHRATSLTTPAVPGQTLSNLALVAGGQNLIYSLSDDTLILTSPLGSLPLTSIDTLVNEFSVQRLANPGGIPTVQAQITLTRGDETRSYQLSVGLRN
ncbi:MAG: type II secretion system protein [bacterium]|nr:type II secretion system protein [bacterium]